MNVQSYTVLHYGKDYLSYAIRSIYHQVDGIHVVYSPHPSHGHKTQVKPIESRCDLVDAALAYNPDRKVSWHEVSNAWQETQHRNVALGICRASGAELALVLDADEVWPSDILGQALDYVWKSNSARDWLVNFTSLWRSFNWVVRDDLWPVRIIDFRHSGGVGYVPKEFGPIYHFGYAVTDKVMRYKWQIHGHKDELRSDWFGTKWSVWPPVPDCHPTNERNFWVPEPFNKELLPDFMREHPFYGLERIE